jgi:SAM (Sterile alpha motif) domain-containing protein
MDIAAWLHRLGLEQYEQAFRDNDVDAEVLQELTGEDLIGLGVTSIGHRRRPDTRRVVTVNFGTDMHGREKLKAAFALVDAGLSPTQGRFPGRHRPLHPLRSPRPTRLLIGRLHAHFYGKRTAERFLTVNFRTDTAGRPSATSQIR